MQSPRNKIWHQIFKNMSNKVCFINLFSINPGFHYTENAKTITRKQNDYKVEQSSFTLIALFWLEISRCRGRNWLNGNQALSQLRPKPRPPGKESWRKPDPPGSENMRIPEGRPGDGQAWNWLIHYSSIYFLMTKFYKFSKVKSNLIFETNTPK